MTGVQTCALPIYAEHLISQWASNRVYSVEAENSDNAVDVVMDQITDDSGWLIVGINYELVESN